MPEITPAQDCGNSPKNLFVQNLTIAFAKADAKFLLASVTDDITWHTIGHPPVNGKLAFAKAFAQLKTDPILELTVTHVLTHGKAGAVNGTLLLKNGPHAFCHIYEFNSAKGTSVKSITSYMIESND